VSQLGEPHERRRIEALFDAAEALLKQRTVSCNKVMVVFATHSVAVLSENDFIRAAKIDALGAA
jgi:hypothetical protein